MCEVVGEKMEEKKQEQFWLLDLDRITGMIVRVKLNLECESLSKSSQRRAKDKLVETSQRSDEKHLRFTLFFTYFRTHRSRTSVILMGNTTEHQTRYHNAECSQQ